MTCALASVLVTLALLAEAGMLTVWTPAVVVTRTLSGQVIALAIRITMTLPLTVRTPELRWTLSLAACPKISMSAATFIRSNTYFVFFAGKVSFTQRCGAFFP